MNHFQNIIVKFLLSILLMQVSLSATDIDLNKLLQEAKKSDKHLLILLTKTGCSWCKKMKETVLDDDEVELFLKKNFILKYIDITKNGTVTFKDFKGSKHKFAKYLGYNFYPTSIFINRDDKIVFSQQGIIYKRKFLLVLEFIKSESYTNFSLQEYIDETEF